MGSLRVITIGMCAILLFGFNAWQLLTPDLIPGDAAGFGVPVYLKLVILIIFGGLIIYVRSLATSICAVLLSFVIGIHVSFNQAGSLSGYLFGFIPLDVEVAVCHDENDNALSVLDRATTIDDTLADFQHSITCSNKSGNMFGYAFFWYKTGPV